MLPLVEQALGWETRLTIAAPVDDPAVLDRFREHPRVTLRGALADLAPLYDAHRLFVAPLLVAAGLPAQVYEAASFGVPVVASDVLCRQLGWQADGDLLAGSTDDPDGFAALVVGLYRDGALWHRLRHAALARLAAEDGRARAAETLRAILG